jgi:multimeric flavodoxin WrbA
MTSQPTVRILVLYDSQTGDVEQMASLVAEGVAGGSPTNMGVLSRKMKKFWDQDMGPHWMKIDGQIGCAFSSAGGWGGGMELACQSILTVLMNFGLLVFGVTDYVSRDLTLHSGELSPIEPAPSALQLRPGSRASASRDRRPGASPRAYVSASTAARIARPAPD